MLLQVALLTKHLFWTYKQTRLKLISFRSTNRFVEITKIICRNNKVFVFQKQILFGTQTVCFNRNNYQENALLLVIGANNKAILLKKIILV